MDNNISSKTNDTDFPSLDGPWVMVFNATFNNISFILRGQFYWWRKSEYPEKTTDLSEVTANLYHRMLYEYNSS